jgi:hypothetical protein
MDPQIQSTMKLLAALVASITLSATSFGQAPLGWTHSATMEKEMGGEGKWYLNLHAKEIIPVRVIEQKIVITLDELDTLMTMVVKKTTMKIASREVPVETKFPCMSFFGTTSDNYPVELHVLVTQENVYSFYAMTLALGAPLPSERGFNLADWQSAMISDKPMRPETHSKYLGALTVIKSRLDSLHGD